MNNYKEMRIKKYKLPKEFWIFLILVVLSVLISIRSSVFYRPDNLIDLVKGGAVLGICSLGMLFVVVSGGIDVSISAVIAVSASLMGNYMFYLKDSIFNNIYIVFVICIISGAALGVINGILIGKYKIPAIVATLGTLAVIRGGLFLITGGYWVNRFDLPEWIVSFGRLTLFGIPIQVIIFVVMIIISLLLIKYTRFNLFGFIPISFIYLIIMLVIVSVVMSRTRFGRNVYATGENINSAKLFGINTDRVVYFNFVITAFFATIAGIIMVGQSSMGAANMARGNEFEALTIIILGGIAITGGRGKLLGVLIAILIIITINNGLVHLGVLLYWKEVVRGVVLVSVVLIDVIRRRGSFFVAIS